MSEPMSDEELAMLKSHALNAIKHQPLSVDANDKLRLCLEVERLRREIDRILEEEDAAALERLEADERRDYR